MAWDKTDKTDLTPTATTATPQVDCDKLLGLSGGELDIFSILGLGFGASERAKELVLKGLLAEQMNILEARAKRGRGRPRKDFLNRDIERAAAVLGADDLWRDSTGEGAPTQSLSRRGSVRLIYLGLHSRGYKPRFRKGWQSLARQ